MNLYLIAFCLFLDKVTPLPTNQLNEGPSPVENKDDDSESLINVLHIEDTSRSVTVPNDIVRDIAGDQDADDSVPSTDNPFRIGIRIKPNDDEKKPGEEKGNLEEKKVFDEVDDVKPIYVSTSDVTEHVEDVQDLPTSTVDALTTEEIVNIGFGTNFEVRPVSLKSSFDNDLNTTGQILPKQRKDDQPITSTRKVSTTIFDGLYSLTSTEVPTTEKRVNLAFANHLLDKESTTTFVPIEKLIVTEESGDTTTEVEKIEERFGNISDVVKPAMKDIASGLCDDQLTISREKEVSTTFDDVSSSTSTTVAAKTVNIGFRNSLGVEESTTVIVPFKHSVVNAENGKTSTENEEDGERIGKILNVIEPAAPENVNRFSGHQPISKSKESIPEGLQSAVFNGVFAIGISDFEKSFTSPDTTSKPSGFKSVFLNLAKKYDSRYKYKYSWSFSGIQKTSPKSLENDGPLFSKEFLSRLAPTGTETIRLDAVNLGETGSIARDNPRKIADYNGLNLYRPSVGSYL